MYCRERQQSSSALQLPRVHPLSTLRSCRIFVLNFALYYYSSRCTTNMLRPYAEQPRRSTRRGEATLVNFFMQSEIVSSKDGKCERSPRFAALFRSRGGPFRSLLRYRARLPRPFSGRPWWVAQSRARPADVSTKECRTR